MAHPDFEDATYAFLRDINKELLIPICSDSARYDFAFGN